MAELIETSPPLPGMRWHLPLAPQKAATAIVNSLLDDEPLAAAPVCEASVHLPRRSRIWVAAFTGPSGGQVWRSTGLTDRDQALLAPNYMRARTGRRRLRPVGRYSGGGRRLFFRCARGQA